MLYTLNLKVFEYFATGVTSLVTHFKQWSLIVYSVAVLMPRVKDALSLGAYVTS